MKHIILEALEATNFKGLGHIKIIFNGKQIYIYGANASGKTSVHDAFTWLAFGKDSQGRSDIGTSGFQVRPVDENGETVDQVDITVEAKLRIEDPVMTGPEILTLTKRQSQNWVRKRGSDAPTFQGNVNTYKINGFNANQKEFSQKISEIIDEDLFRLLTDPRAFASMKWQTQRETLLRFVEDVTDADIMAADSEKYAPIADDVLEAGAERGKEKASTTLRALKKEMEQYPVRIDEATKAIVSGLDADDVGSRRAELTGQLQAIQAERDTLSEALEGTNKLQAEIVKVHSAMIEIEGRESIRVLTERRKKQGDVDIALSELRTIADDMNRKLSRRDALIAGLERDTGRLKELTAEYRAERKRTMSPEKPICPTCGKPFDKEEIERMLLGFEKLKKEKLIDIEAKGRATKKVVDETTASIAELTAEVDALKAKYSEQSARAEELKAELSKMPGTPDMSACEDYQKASARLKELQARLSTMSDGDARKQAITAQEAGVREQLRQVDADVAALEANKRTEERVEELREELADCSQKVAKQEQKVWLFEELIKAKMSMLTDKINSHFEAVTFKLFDRQQNGALKETCIMQVNSNGSFVDYLDANNAAQIQGGLDVIRALTELYGVAAPIWLDNRESVTDIPEMDTQIINLVVSPEDETLRVE